MSEQVSIRPEVSILSVLRHLNYEWWFALAEFVDNALASFQANKASLGAVGVDVLEVSIERIGDHAIAIRDNAAGIRRADLDRALKAAAAPPDRSGLSEFGMGMKSAACWCGRRWSVFTSALGENRQYYVDIDVEKVVSTRQDIVEVKAEPSSSDTHFTRIKIEQVDSLPIGRTVGKIRSHMRDIYRQFLRNGTLRLEVFGEVLEYEDPPTLVGPCVVPGLETEEPLVWKKQVRIDLSRERRVDGWVAIRETGSQSEAGLSLFRRDRVVLGTADTKYRPKEIFGRGNSYRSQRVHGELHLHGFQTTHTKDGLRWDGAEHELLQKLKEQLLQRDLPLLKQAEEYRVRASKSDIKKSATKAARRQEQSLRRTLPESVGQASRVTADTPMETATELPAKALLDERSVEFESDDHTRWVVRVEATDDEAQRELFEIANRRMAGPSTREVTIRLGVAHPFVVQWIGTDVNKLEVLIRLVVGFGIAEVLAKEGSNTPAAVTRMLNELLRSGLERA